MKFLKILLRLPCLVLEVTFDGGNALLVGVVGFLIITIIAGHNGNASRMSLMPILATLGTLPSAHDGDLGWCSSTISCGRFHVTQDKGGPKASRVVMSSSSLVVFGCSRPSS
jgi:hypothetical protein